MDARQGSIPNTGPEHTEDRIVGRKALGEQVPLTTRLVDMQQNVHDESKVSSWPTQVTVLYRVLKVT
jgi:hypothetical protein